MSNPTPQNGNLVETEVITNLNQLRGWAEQAINTSESLIRNYESYFTEYVPYDPGLSVQPINVSFNKATQPELPDLYIAQDPSFPGEPPKPSDRTLERPDQFTELPINSAPPIPPILSVPEVPPIEQTLTSITLPPEPIITTYSPPNVDTTVPDLTLPSDPTLEIFAVPNVDVGLSEPVLPPLPLITSYSPPTLDTTIPEVTLPTEPEIVLPSPPNLEAITLPTPLDLTGELDAIIAELDALSSGLSEYEVTVFNPTVNFEPAYLDSEIIDNINALITTDFNLPVNVTNAIWERGKSKELSISQRNRNQQLIEYAQSGFKRPQGSHYAALDYATQESQNKLADFSREVSIKQIEYYQKNLEVILPIASNMAQLLINENVEIQKLFYNKAQLEIDTMKYLLEAQINQFKIDMEVYKTQALILESQIKGLLGQVESQKLDIESQKLIGTINQQTIDIYSKNVEILNTKVELYKNQVEATNAIVENNNKKILMAKNLVDLYAAEIQSNGANVELYKNQILAANLVTDSNNSKLQEAKTKVDLYATQLQSNNTLVDVYKNQILSLNAVVENNSYKLQNAKNLVDLYATQIQSNDANVELYKNQIAATNAILEGDSKKLQNAKNQVDIYTAQIQANGAHVDLYGSQVKAKSLETEEFKAKADAYAARMKAFASYSDTISSQIQSDIQSYKAQMDAYIAKLESLIKAEELRASVNSSLVPAFDALAKMYIADNAVEEKKADVDLKAAEISINNAMIAKEIALKNASETASNVLQYNSLLFDAQKSIAQVQSQLAASTMAAINVGASMGSNVSSDQNFNYNYELT